MFGTHVVGVWPGRTRVTVSVFCNTVVEFARGSIEGVRDEDEVRSGGPGGCANLVGGYGFDVEPGVLSDVDGADVSD